jgi:hypothetical protein
MELFMTSRPFSRVVGATVAACLFALAPMASAGDPPVPVSAQPSLAQLSFIGLPADRLLAAGLSRPEITVAAQRLRESGTQLDALEAALLQLAIAQSLVKSLEAHGQAAGSEQTPSDALAAAQAALASCEASVTALRTSLRQVVLVDASVAQQSLLARALLGAQIGIDGALSLAGEDEAAQHQLAVALQAESRSVRIGEELDPEYQQLLSTARAMPEVAAAAARLAAEWEPLQASLSASPNDGQP